MKIRIFKNNENVYFARYLDADGDWLYIYGSSSMDLDRCELRAKRFSEQHIDELIKEFDTE